MGGESLKKRLVGLSFLVVLSIWASVWLLGGDGEFMRAIGGLSFGTVTWLAVVLLWRLGQQWWENRTKAKEKE